MVTHHEMWCLSIKLYINFGWLVYGLLFGVYLTYNGTVYGGCRIQETEQCESICQYDRITGERSCALRALALLPATHKIEASLSKVLPVLEIAENRSRELQLIPDYVTIEWFQVDDRCDSAFATIGAMDGYAKHCAHVIFGPSCDYALASAGRIVKYFRSEGTPLLSVGGYTYDFVKKKTSCDDEFHMLIRTGMLSFKSMARFLISLMQTYQWSHAAFFYEREGHFNVGGRHTCHLLMKTMADSFREFNITYSAFVTDSASTWSTTENLKREIGVQHAIVVMCANAKKIREIMLAADELNMINSGEYVFFNVELFASVSSTVQPWFDTNDTDERNSRARNAYTALLQLTATQPQSADYERFSDQVKALAVDKYNYTFPSAEPVSTFVTAFHDAFLLYAYALNETLTLDENAIERPLNGTDLTKRMWNRKFDGITGKVIMNENGDRVSDYSLLDLNPDTGLFEIVANYFPDLGIEFLNDKMIHWAGNRLSAPPDKPQCGFDNSLCPDKSLPGYAILSIVLGFVVIVMGVISFVGYRHYKLESEINSMTWKIHWEDILISNYDKHPYSSKRGSQLTFYSDDLGSLADEKQIFIPVGFFRGCKVAIKSINNSNVCLSRALLLELKNMKDLQHDHLVRFYGACLDLPNCSILTEYCPRGSLQDILENEQFTLDWTFKKSLMQDIVRGMQFLHSTNINSHGNLKSSNCVVDSRFVLKITDFGLHDLRRANNDEHFVDFDSHSYWKSLLWTAPELLRLEFRPAQGTQKGDVYSFGIMIHEIITRQGPFFLGDDNWKSPKEIIKLVEDRQFFQSPPFRPKICDFAFEELNTLMRKCWSEEPEARPDFRELKTIFRLLNSEGTGNILDNLLQRMEQYANNLESLVDDRTKNYLEEKRKCEDLLYQLLPKSTALQLIRGQPVIAETYDQVSIYFSDIVGFTSISAESSPMQVVNLLNELYTCFDSIIENFDVYKVETIGDAYMVASGLPTRNGNLHARELARMALALLQAVQEFKIPHRQDEKLLLRIGLHSGPCVAGVVGLKMPRYCLFGDTVNTASRMESNGEALKIHVSNATKQILDTFGTFDFTARGMIPVKGKGIMQTFWLQGEQTQAADEPIKAATVVAAVPSHPPSVHSAAGINYGLFGSDRLLKKGPSSYFKVPLAKRTSRGEDHIRNVIQPLLKTQ